MEKRALIIGATGLVGGHLTRQLLRDDTFSGVRIFGRTSTGIIHPKLEEIETDFNHLERVRDRVRGDVLFSCLGTTRQNAGSKDAQYLVDYTYQFEFARIAAENQVPDYMLISSPGADPGSMFFYTRIKGELDRDVKALPFRRHIFIQPSILRGERRNARMAERLTARIIDSLSRIIPPLRKYKSIHGSEVAKAMIKLYKTPEANGIYALDKLR